MNNTNPNQGHRGSMQEEYSCDFDNNSTPSYGGDSSGRSASTGHIQYQSFYPPSTFFPGYNRQRSSSQFQGPLPGWQPFDFSQHYNQPQTANANGVDPGELAGYSRAVDEGPWSVAGVGSVPGPRLQQNSQLPPPPGFLDRAHTITAVPLSPNSGRVPLHHGRASIPDSQESGQESGYGSLNIGVQGNFQSQRGLPEFNAEARELYPLNAPPPTPKSVKSESQVQTTEETKRKKKVKIQIPPCRECGKQVKNQSDARKHLLTHTKPFTCEVPACSRREGFATKNDLQRHRKSVHNAVPSLGKRFGYICQACPSSGPVSPPKWWPRLDNFTAHVNRKHKDWDPNDLIKISEAPRPENAVSESGYASQAPSVMAEDQRYQHDLSSPIGTSMARQGSYQDSMTFGGPEYGHFDPLAGVGAGQLADPFIGAREPTPRPHGPRSGSMSHGLTALGDAAFQLQSPVDSLLASPGAPRTGVPSVHITNVVYDTPLSPPFNPTDWSVPPLKRRKPNYMESSKQQSPPSSSTAAVPDTNSRSAISNGNTDNLSANRTASGDYACNQCSTVWKRECDLRKHNKRHTRPYGCTFPNCYKRFGSRNDWKRHENSQHFLQEMWRCGVENPTATSTGSGEEEKKICGKLIYQEETFTIHLQRRHSIPPNSSQSHTLLRTMHLGREGHHHFWCGFCAALVAQTPQTPENLGEPQMSAWALRLKHIGDHFDKGGEHVSAWVCIEHGKKKGLITREDRKKARGRLRGWGLGVGGRKEESVELPEDGIPDLRGGEGEVDDDAEGESDGGW